MGATGSGSRSIDELEQVFVTGRLLKYPVDAGLCGTSEAGMVEPVISTQMPTLSFVDAELEVAGA